MKTAVDWLIEQIHTNLPSYELLNFDQKFYFIELVKQAKEMEKEQIIDAHIAGMEFIAVDPKHYIDDANEYYDSKYKKGKNE